MTFFGKTFRTTFLFIVLFELLSFWGYLYPAFNSIAFIIIAVLFLAICLKRLDWGVYILLAELFIGSKGYLFYYILGGTAVSIRIAFWLIIMGVWFAKTINYWLREKKNLLPPLTPPVRGETANLIIEKTQYSLPGQIVSYATSQLIFSYDTGDEMSKLKYGKFFKSKLFYWFMALFAIIGWSLLMGIIRGNVFNNIFDDANAYLFFGLVFVFYDAITNQEQTKQLMQVFTASITAMALKTIGLLYLFSHQFPGLSAVYKWIRTSGVGEITKISDIYIIIGFVIVLAFLLFKKNHSPLTGGARGGNIANNIKTFYQSLISSSTSKYLSLLFLLLTSTIIISLSRSFWLGLILGLIALFVYYTINEQFSYKKFIINSIIVSTMVFYLLYIYSTKYYLSLFLAVIIIFYVLVKLIKLSTIKVINFVSLVVIFFVLGLTLINGVIKFPIPSTGVSVSLTETVGDRAITISGEAAVSSRWNLIGPLFKEIIKIPTILVGAGFGSTVTYQSTDPRVLERNPSGIYTTYAFEWGYLDLWLKLGLIGLLIYLALLGRVLIMGWSILQEKFHQINDNKSILVLGLLTGLLILIIIHGFTPYLNHPLGIGYLLLCAVIFEIIKRNNNLELA